MIVQTIELLDRLISDKKSQLSSLKGFDKYAIADQKNLYREQLLLYREIDELIKQRQFMLDIDLVDAIQLNAERIYRRNIKRSLLAPAKIYDLALVELVKKIAMIYALKQAMFNHNDNSQQHFESYTISK